MSKLKIGILIDDWKLAAWSYKIIEIIQESDFASITLVIKRGVKTASVSPSDGKWLYKLYRRLDRSFFTAPIDAFARKDLRNFLPDTVTVIEPEIKATRHVDYFAEESNKQIAAHQPDVLIRLGFRILKGPILEIPRYGIWSFHHGDNLVNKGGPPCFWEVMLGWPITGSVLQILTEKLDDGKVLYRSWSQTNPLSVNRNANKVYWKSLYFIPRLLERLHKNGQDALDEALERAKANPVENTSLFRPPGNTQMLGLLWKFSLRNIQRKFLESRRKYRWHLWIGPANQVKPNEAWHRILPPRDRFFADPCIIEEQGRTVLFFEDFPYSTQKGVISAGFWDGESLKNVCTVLEEPHHLSFPQVWKQGEKWLMLPEAKESGTITLYESTQFPFKWKKGIKLMDGVKAIDPVLIFKDGYWWLFFNQATGPGTSAFDELFLYFKKDIDQGDWIAHPMNPIVSDVRAARMAGRLLEKDGQWYRAGQDCSLRYGYAFSLFAIKQWDIQSYREETVEKIQPDWSADLQGTHTFSRSEHYTLVDAYTW